MAQAGSGRGAAGLEGGGGWMRAAGGRRDPRLRRTRGGAAQTAPGATAGLPRRRGLRGVGRTFSFWTGPARWGRGGGAARESRRARGGLHPRAAAGTGVPLVAVEPPAVAVAPP